MTLAQTMPEALIVVDVQRGFADPAWSTRTNPACGENAARLIDAPPCRGSRSAS